MYSNAASSSWVASASHCVQTLPVMETIIYTVSLCIAATSQLLMVIGQDTSKIRMSPLSSTNSVIVYSYELHV